MMKHEVTMGVRRQAKHVSVIDIAGEMTGFAEDALMQAYQEASADGCQAIVLNFRDLEYMNSSGIGLLVTMLIRVQRQKQQLLAYGLSEHYQQIFQLTRLNEAIGLYNDETTALSAVAAPA